MSNRTIEITDELYAYLLDTSLREPEILRRLREETLHMPHAGMQISPEQGQFMSLLVELIGARKTFEVGTFTGYSALAVALALPPGGKLIACDISKEWTAIGQRYWQEAGVADKIDLRLGPGEATLNKLLQDGQGSTFDFAFIDADKEGYETYYECALKLLRPGGLVAIDNVLWDGAVIDPADHTADTEAIRAFNRKLKDDARVMISLVPIGDGLTLARKRA